MSDGAASGRGTCPCCGRRTLDAAAPGSYLTCPVCYWTDIELDTPAAQQALFDGQRSQQLVGVCDPRWSAAVRPAREDEPVDPDWLPMAGLAAGEGPRHRRAEAVLHAIDAAFAGVSPEGRVPLRAAYRADYHGREPDLDWDDADTDWRAVPGDVLDFFAGRTSVFVFGNERSFRYYLPAYLRQAVRTGSFSTAVQALDRKLAPGAPPERLAEVAILDRAQRDAVVAFLELVLAFGGPDEAAQRALDRVWRPSTPPRCDGGVSGQDTATNGRLVVEEPTEPTAGRVVPVDVTEERDGLDAD